MADQLTTTGLEIDSLEDRKTRIESDIHSNISENLDLSTDTPLGQIVEIFSEKIQSVAELLQESYGAWDPDQATGVSLSSLSRLTGTLKKRPTYGTVVLTINIDNGVTVPAGSLVSTAADTQTTWATDTAVTNSTGIPANFNVNATCTVLGRKVAAGGTLTNIISTIPGWNTSNNSDDANPGEDLERDEDLRVRRDAEVFLPGRDSIGALRAGVYAIDGVESAVVYNNPSPIPTAQVPTPHGVHIVIWDGSPASADDDELAEAIFQNLSSGTEPYGSTDVVYVDSEGTSHTMRFSRCTQILINAQLNLYYDPDYVGDAVVEAAVEDFINSLEPGENVYRSEIMKVVTELAGVVYIEMSGGSVPQLAINPAGLAAQDITIDVDEKAIANNITINSTVFTG